MQSKTKVRATVRANHPALHPARDSVEIRLQKQRHIEWGAARGQHFFERGGLPEAARKAIENNLELVSDIYIYDISLNINHLSTNGL